MKPENCLIDIRGHVKLADFGSCIRMDDRDLVSSIETVGTPDYIPPEVLRSHEGKISYGRECDWWSVGVVIYELLYDEVPFFSESLAEVYAKIMDYEVRMRLNTCSYLLTHTQRYLCFPEEPIISDDAKDLIRKLLCDKESRLGRRGSHEIKGHPFFSGINWTSVRQSPLTAQNSIQK